MRRGALLVYANVFIVALVGTCLATECRIAEDAFAVLEPSLITRACHLYFYSKTVIDPSEFSVTRKEDSHADPWKSEFIRLHQEKRLVTFTKSTPVFDCHHRLREIKRDPESAELLGMALPQFPCLGRPVRLVPVRAVNYSTCYWVAIDSVECP